MDPRTASVPACFRRCRGTCSSPGPANQLKDKRVAHTLKYGVVHSESVDNFVAFSQGTGAATTAATGVFDELQRSGLAAHPVIAEKGGEALGWFFASDRPIVSAKHRRLWRIRLTLEHVLRRPTLSGKEVEVLIGHITHVFLMRRECLSCLNSVYAFIKKAGHQQVKVWPNVRLEMRHARALLCFCFRDLHQQVCTNVLAVDASEWGCGVVESFKSAVDVTETMRYNERWRFVHGSRGARVEALGPEFLPKHVLKGVDVDSSISKVDVVGADDDNLSKNITALRSSCIDEDYSAIIDDCGTSCGVIQSGRTDQSCEAVSRVPAVSESMLQGPWKVICSRRWKFIEGMPSLETRAALWGLRHQLRNKDRVGQKLLILSDSMSCVLALAKGMSSNPKHAQAHANLGSSCSLF